MFFTAIRPTGGEMMDEKMLIKKSKQGDKDSFGELYMLYRDRLYRYAVFKLGEKSAPDVVSECIVQAWSSIKSLRSENAFDAWIFRILHRCCSAQIKEDIKQRESVSIDDAVIPYTENFKAVELSEALSLLDETDKDIVLLSAVSGFNSKEIGRLLGLRPATVRSKLSRSLKKMRDFLEDTYEKRL